MSMKDLVDPGGTPLVKEPNVAIVKVSNAERVDPETLSGLAQSMKCDVVLLPFNSEVLRGELAINEMMAVHAAIHMRARLIPLDLTREDATVLLGMVQRITEQLKPSEDSQQMKMLRRLQKATGVKDVKDTESRE